ncbi:MAG: 4Fe-4S double cluster binding domain-containing protein [Candidatus Hodarchaeota archaeon]
METDTNNLTKKVKEYTLGLDIDAIGIAGAENEMFLQAPDKYQPRNVLENAKSVIVFGKSMPKSIFKLKNHETQLIHRAYHSIYKFLDIAAVRLCKYLESEGYYGISIPSYVPLTIKNLQPWGVISLKHAGMIAGLGKIAKNGLLIHPEFGTLLRLSAVITDAPLVADEMMEGDICLDCDACIKNCPKKALSEDGKFKKIRCLQNVVKHGVNKFHDIRKPPYLNNIELVTNTMLLEYSIGCVKCLQVCPLNKKPIRKKN